MRPLPILLAALLALAAAPGLRAQDDADVDMWTPFNTDPAQPAS